MDLTEVIIEYPWVYFFVIMVIGVIFVFAITNKKKKMKIVKLKRVREDGN